MYSVRHSSPLAQASTGQFRRRNALLASPHVVVDLVVVEGQEETEDGDEDDDVAGENEAARTPLDHRVGCRRRPCQHQWQAKGRDDDARGDEVGQLLRRARARHVLLVAASNQRRQRRQHVEEDHEEGVPIAGLWQCTTQHQ